jgi:hypothetical protein
MSKYPLRAALLKGFMKTETSGDDHCIVISFEKLEDMQEARKALYHALLEKREPVTPWDQPSNRSYQPVESLAKMIFDEHFAVDNAGKRWRWFDGGNSTMQDRARDEARKQLRLSGHSDPLSVKDRPGEAP